MDSRARHTGVARDYVEVELRDCMAGGTVVEAVFESGEFPAHVLAAPATRNDLLRGGRKMIAPSFS